MLPVGAVMSASSLLSAVSLPPSPRAATLGGAIVSQGRFRNTGRGLRPRPVFRNLEELPKVIRLHIVSCADVPIMTLRDHLEVKTQA